MNLYITKRTLSPLVGIIILPEYMGSKVTHLTLASREWDNLCIDIDEELPEGSLRFLPSKCKKISVSCPAKPSLHQIHLLAELFPKLDGKLRKAYMKGEEVNGLLPEMWEHGEEA